MAKRKLALFKQDGEVYYITDSDAQSKLLEVNRKLSDYATTSELTEMDERLRSEINSAKFDGEYSSLKGAPDLSQYITEEKLNEKAYATKKELNDLKLEAGTFTINDEIVGTSSAYSSQKIHNEYALKSEIVNVDLNGYATIEALNEKANSADVYSKTEANNKFLTNETLDLSGYATKKEIPTIPESLPASDVHEWAKTETKPTYSVDEIIGLTAQLETVNKNINSINSVLEENYFDITFLVIDGVKIARVIDETTAVSEDITVGTVDTPSFQLTKFNGREDLIITVVPEEGRTINENSLIIDGDYEKVNFSAKKNQYTIKNITSNLTCAFVAEGGSETGFAVSFEPIDGEIDICSTNKLDQVVETLSAISSSWSTQTRNKDIGIKTTDPEYAQVNFIIKPKPGYQVKSVKESGAVPKPYNKIKGPEDTGVENGYTITQVKAPINIIITLEAIEKTLGDYFITDAYTKTEANSVFATKNDVLDKQGAKIDDTTESTTAVYSSDKTAKTFLKLDSMGQTINAPVNINNNISISGTATVGGKNIATENWVEEKNYLTEHQSLAAYALKTDIPSLAGYQETLISGTNLKKVNGYSLLGAGTVTLKESDLTADRGYITAESLNNYATKFEVQSAGYLTAADIANKANKATTLEGYGITDAYTTTQVDGKIIKTTSGLSNDAGFITTSALEGYATENWVDQRGFLKEHQSLNGYAKTADIPTKVSQLIDASSYATTTYVSGEIAKIKQFSVVKTNSLDEVVTPSKDVLYLIPKNSGSTSNVYNEYLYTDDGYELIGDTAVSLDGYAKTSEIPTKISQLENDKNYLTEHQTLDGKQDKLVSGTNIKTICGNTLLGSGNIALKESNLNHDMGYALQTSVDEKQATLVSGTNIKTINEISLLGSGNIAIAVPTKVSELTNDKNYLTEHQSLTEYAKKTEITNYITEFAKIMFPVGSIYMSTSKTNPSTFLGGTWIAWGAGRVPVGVGTGTDVNGTLETFEAEKTGGEYRHAITTDEIPEHTHNFKVAYTDVQDPSNASSSETTEQIKVEQLGYPITTDESQYITSKAYTTDANTLSENAEVYHNNIQPYITCYMWKRTAL